MFEQVQKTIRGRAGDVQCRFMLVPSGGVVLADTRITTERLEIRVSAAWHALRASSGTDDCGTIQVNY